MIYHDYMYIYMCVYKFFRQHQLRAGIELTSTQDLFLCTFFFWHPGQIITNVQAFNHIFKSSPLSIPKVSQRSYIQRLGLILRDMATSEEFVVNFLRFDEWTKVEPYPPPLPTMPPLPNQLTDQERSWTLKIG